MDFHHKMTGAVFWGKDPQKAKCNVLLLWLPAEFPFRLSQCPNLSLFLPPGPNQGD